jgi:hypothetical protein
MYFVFRMERKLVKVWYDAEGDYLEVVFERKEGYFRGGERYRLFSAQG